MKIYTADIEVMQPANKAVHAPLNSKYGIGLQFTENGVPKTLAEGEVKMDGQTADNIIDDRLFVFNRESGTDENVIVHDVAVGSPAIIAQDSHIATLVLSNRRNTWFPSSVALSSLIDKPVEVTYDQILIYTRYSKNTPIEDEDFTCINYDTSFYWGNFYINQNGTLIYLWPQRRQFCYDSGSGWVYIDKVTISPDSTATVRGMVTGPGTFYRELKIDINVPSNIKHYKVTENQEEQGKAIGYSEVPILSSITLSGTLEDDTPFSYTLPTT